MSTSSSSQHAPQHSGHVVDAETDSQKMQNITTTAIVVPMTPQSNQLISTVGGPFKKSQEEDDNEEEKDDDDVDDDDHGKRNE
jgi:hypothetical protein